jgi:hypothetical protein
LGKRPLRKPRYRWEGSIKIDLKEIRWEKRIGLIYPRIGCERSKYPSGSIIPAIP